MTDAQPSERDREAARPAWRQYGMAVAAALGAILLRATLFSSLGTTAAYVLFYPAVMVVAVFGGLGPGLLCIALCGLAALYLWVPPAYSLRIEKPGDQLGLLLFLVTASILVFLGKAQRRARWKAFQSGRAFVRSERRTQDILESISDGFCSLDREGRYAYVNAAAERYFGRPRGSLVGRADWGAFPGALGPLVEQRCREAIAHGEAVHFEAHGSSTALWLDVSAYPSPDGISVYFRDVTERKAADQEKAVLLTRERLARERAVRLQKITESFSRTLTVRDVADLALRLGMEMLGAASGAVFFLNEEGDALELVEAAGIEPEARQRIGRMACSAQAAPAQAVRTGAPVILETYGEWSRSSPDEVAAGVPPGARVVVPLVVSGRAIGCITFDFRDWRVVDDEERALALALAQQCAQAGERARLFDLQQKARAAAEAANRLKDEFLATVSHELRTPLNAIVGWAQVLRESPRDEDLTARGLELIQRNGRAQERLIRDILDVSRIVTGGLSLDARPVDPAAAVEAAVEAVRPVAETKGLRLQATFETGGALVLADLDRLQQIAWNLVTNAVKFTPEGGTVAVGLAREGAAVVLKVSDTGEGIAPEFLPFVFDRFRQADSSSRRRHSGIGLGLALVRHLVDLHHGTVEGVSPGPGRGSTFTVRLPMVRGVAQPAARPSAVRRVPASVPVGGLKVLLVEDDADSREGVALFLRRAGAEVACAATAEEALAVLRRDAPDVLVADIAIPDQDGYALIERVRALPAHEGGGTPAIALTGWGREEDRAAAILAGFHAYLVKPADPGELTAIVARLGGGGSVPPSTPPGD